MTGESNANAKTEEKADNEPNQPNVPEPEVPEDEKWMIRDCDTYYEEYSECTSFRGRFHQYFIFGESIDCNQWKKDYDNCSKWKDNNDCKAGLAVIKSEKERRFQRLKAHYQNDIWKKRDGPPADWNKPLPEWMVKRDENTYLALKAKELQEGKITLEKDKSFCTIM